MKQIEKQAYILARQKKISQKELAHKIGVSPSTLSRYFSGESDMPSKAFIKMMEVFGFNLEEALSNCEDPEELKFKNNFEKEQYLKLCDWYQKSVDIKK